MPAPSDLNIIPNSLPQYLQENLGTQDFRELINSLPKERGWLTPNMYNYKGFWFSAFHLQGALNFQQHFQAQDSDIMLITLPKSGTIWLKALVFALITRKQFLVSQETHPVPAEYNASGKSLVSLKQDLECEHCEWNKKLLESSPHLGFVNGSTLEEIQAPIKETGPQSGRGSVLFKQVIESECCEKSNRCRESFHTSSTPKEIINVPKKEINPLPKTCNPDRRNSVPIKQLLEFESSKWSNRCRESFSHPNNNGLNPDTHPLLTNNPHELIPFMEVSYARSKNPNFPLNNGLRLLSTHLPYKLLPKSVQESNCKLIYLCRNPKDTLVSYWHFVNKLRDENHSPKTISLCEALDSYCKGVSLTGPFWDHTLGYWKESSESPRKVLFLKYEDIKENPDDLLRRIAGFLGCPFSEEEEECGIVDEILELCSFERLSNLEVNKSGKGVFGNENSVMFRKGQVGDWRNHLSDEMANRIDQIVEEKFNGTGLKF